MNITFKYEWLKKINWRVFFADIISGVLLIVFLYTGLTKLSDYEKFNRVLEETPGTKQFAEPLARILPLIEIGLAIVLFLPATRRKGLRGSLILLILFTLYLIYMVLFASHLPCNCGGVLENLSWRQHIFFNLFLIGLSLIGIHLYKSLIKQPNKSPP